MVTIQSLSAVDEAPGVCQKGQTPMTHSMTKKNAAIQRSFWLIMCVSGVWPLDTHLLNSNKKCEKIWITRDFPQKFWTLKIWNEKDF